MVISPISRGTRLVSSMAWAIASDRRRESWQGCSVTTATDYLKILSLGVIDWKLLEPLSPSSEVLKGEVVHAVEDEMAMTLEDFMERRTEIGRFHSDHDVDVAETAATLMGARLDWDESERKRQVEGYRSSAEELISFGANREKAVDPVGWIPIAVANIPNIPLRR